MVVRGSRIAKEPGSVGDALDGDIQLTETRKDKVTIDRSITGFVQCYKL